MTLTNQCWILAIMSSIVAVAVIATEYKILIGRTGNGKSYIIRLQGCNTKSCSGSDACTQQSEICDVGGVKYHDTIGTDDDAVHVINHNDQEIRLSGFIYPVYEMFTHLEANKISEVQFFAVQDANNIREGGSFRALKKFIEENLKCPITNVLNKFRDSEPDHERHRQDADIIVYNHQNNPVALKGKSCQLALAPDWRERLISQDFQGVQSLYTAEICRDIQSRKRELEMVQMNKWEALDLSNCLYWGDTGDTYCKRRNIFGRCTKRVAVQGWKTDPDCVRRRDLKNQDITVRNLQRAEYEKTVQNQFDEIKNLLQQCSAVRNL